MQLLNSKEIEQKALEAIEIACEHHDYDGIDMKPEKTLANMVNLLTTACQQAQGDRWNNVDYSNPKAFPTVEGEYSVVIKAFFDKEAGFLDEHSNQVYATHWQPLPSAPAEKKRLLSEITDEHFKEAAAILDPWMIGSTAWELTRDEHCISLGDTNGRYVKMMFVNGAIFCSDNQVCNNATLVDFLRLHYSI